MFAHVVHIAAVTATTNPHFPGHCRGAFTPHIVYAAIRPPVAAVYAPPLRHHLPSSAHRFAPHASHYARLFLLPPCQADDMSFQLHTAITARYRFITPFHHTVPVMPRHTSTPRHAVRPFTAEPRRSPPCRAEGARRHEAFDADIVQRPRYLSHGNATLRGTRPFCPHLLCCRCKPARRAPARQARRTPFVVHTSRPLNSIAPRSPRPNYASGVGICVRRRSRHFSSPTVEPCRRRITPPRIIALREYHG